MARRYSMRRRSTVVEQTRQRIVDATVELHNEQGVTATSMQDIAERAGVALATVYRHFPSLEDLVPACGRRNMELNPPPTEAVLAGLHTAEQRVVAVVEALYANYESGCRPYEVGLAESTTLPVMAQQMEEVAAHVAGLVAAAIKPFKPDARQLRLAVGLCDFRVWRSLTQAGLATDEAVAFTTRSITAALAKSTDVKKQRDLS
jgi:AcrR family transcriptional regulator